MSPSQFKWATFVLRRRAEDGVDVTLMDLVLDAEAMIEGKPTILPREEIVAAIEREVAS